MTNTDDGSREQAANSADSVRLNTAENMGGSVRELNPPTPPTPPTGKDSLGSDLHPTSSTSTREPATVDEPIGSSAASPTERNPVPTPPPSNPAPSLRPVEELQALCDAATPGPWVRGQPHNMVRSLDPRLSAIAQPLAAGNKANDAEFIAAARTALPALLARLRAAEEALARATSLDTLFDVLLEAQYGGMRPGGEEREAVAQLAEAVQPLLRAALARGTQLVEGLTMRDVVDCFVRACYESSGLPIEQWPGTVHDLPDLDLMAVSQNLTCNIEKRMGIYPNVPHVACPECDRQVTMLHPDRCWDCTFSKDGPR